MKDREIKLNPIGNALSKQIPLKVNGFAENKEFPASAEISPRENLRKLPGYGISYTCNALSKQNPIESQWILPKQGISNTCELFEGISRVSGLGPAHLGKSEFSRQS